MKRRVRRPGREQRRLRLHDGHADPGRRLSRQEGPDLRGGDRCLLRSDQRSRVLTEFKTIFGFGTGVTATYDNDGDLGLGREMHCKAYPHPLGFGVACYATNYSGTDGQAVSTLRARVVSTTNAVTVRRPPHGQRILFNCFRRSIYVCISCF